MAIETKTPKIIFHQAHASLFLSNSCRKIYAIKTKAYPNVKRRISGNKIAKTIRFITKQEFEIIYKRRLSLILGVFCGEI